MRLKLCIYLLLGINKISAHIKEDFDILTRFVYFKPPHKKSLLQPSTA